jgi:hypothetical protein
LPLIPVMNRFRAISYLFSQQYLITKTKTMKASVITIIAFCLASFNYTGFSQNDEATNNNVPENKMDLPEKRKLNFFVVSKRKKGKLDLATRYNVLRTKLKSFFRRQKFVSIVAESAEQASAKIQYRLEKYNAGIGTVWFDSHGMYKKGYSLFFIGRDEISYKTLKDSVIISPFQQLAFLADNESRIVIGSCYGGATYQRLSIDYRDTTRMNGDSLMIGLGNIFNRSLIYGSESWVMTKPGLFLKGPAVAGFPGRKLFRDVCYRPAWENMGKWNEYNAATKTFTSINPVTLDMYGTLKVRTRTYTDRKEVKKDILKNLEKLETGLYK